MLYSCSGRKVKYRIISPSRPVENNWMPRIMAKMPTMRYPVRSSSTVVLLVEVLLLLLVEHSFLMALVL